MNSDVLEWRSLSFEDDFIKEWKPHALSHDEWPPDYRAVYVWRAKILSAFKKDPRLLEDAKKYYATHRKEFIMHWMDTYDPRRNGPKWVPFVFFLKQAEFIDFLEDLRNSQENGLIEKARDMGATWGAAGYSVACWLTIPDDAIGWGSRKEMLVDKIGDPDSIFEKLRLIINRLPAVFRPAGLKPKEHLTHLKCVNPENGSIIAGEAGDNIGRGGRKSMYFKDESAHYERPEKVEAALGDNTNVQVDISSVNGLGNAFHRRREAGIVWQPGSTIESGYTRIFIIDWRDHPDKTDEWYNKRKAKAEREGMLHIFAQEVDRNYSAAISNTIIPYEYITSAIDAHLKIPCLMRRPQDIPNIHMGGLDVADGGIDRNAFALRQWIICRHVEEWGERDPGVTARRAIAGVRNVKNAKVMYDAVGLGSSIKAEYNRLKIDEKLDIPPFVPWNAGASPLRPHERVINGDVDSAKNKDYFKNIKAQAWWALYARFYKTWRCIEAIKNGLSVPDYDSEELISLDSAMPLLNQLMQELAQATRGESSDLRTIVNKQPEGTKSPNLADAVVMAYFPVPDDYGSIIVGNYGG